MKRRLFVPALALLAGLAFSPSSNAAFIVEVSEHFHIDSTLPTTFSGVTFGFGGAGLGAISNESFSGLAFTNTFSQATTGASVATPTSIAISFTPNAFLADGTLKFTTVVNTDNLSWIQSNIFTTGATVTGQTGQTNVSYDALSFRILGPVAVPEPTSSAMFGIGIALAVGLGWNRKRRELAKLAA